MKKVLVTASDFSGKFLVVNGDYTIEINSLDLIRGIICIGYSDWRGTFRGGFRRYSEILHHAFGMIAYTQEVNNHLALAKNFRSLDMSEKIPITYNLGMGISKIIAERLLEIPWLLHVDELVRNGNAKTTAGTRERGDLAGKDMHDRWHVLEAKGRSNRPSNDSFTKGKNQAGRVLSINGITPSTKSVCVSCFQETQTNSYLVDPDNGDNMPATYWEIDNDNFLHYYYQRFVEDSVISRDVTEKIHLNGKEYQFNIVSPKESEFRIGIYSPIFDAVKSKSLKYMDDLRMLQERVKLNKYENYGDMYYSVGLDGIIVFVENRSL